MAIIMLMIIAEAAANGVSCGVGLEGSEAAVTM